MAGSKKSKLQFSSGTWTGHCLDQGQRSDLSCVIRLEGTSFTGSGDDWLRGGEFVIFDGSVEPKKGLVEWYQRYPERQHPLTGDITDLYFAGRLTSDGLRGDWCISSMEAAQMMGQPGPIWVAMGRFSLSPPTAPAESAPSSVAQRIILNARLSQICSALGAIRYSADGAYTGDRASGTHVLFNGQGDHLAFVWSGTTVIALEYDHERSPRQSVADLMSRLSNDSVFSAGLREAGGLVNGLASGGIAACGDETFSFGEISQLSSFQGEPWDAASTWAEGRSLSDEQIELAVRLAGQTDRYVFKAADYAAAAIPCEEDQDGVIDRAKARTAEPQFASVQIRFSASKLPKQDR